MTLICENNDYKHVNRLKDGDVCAFDELFNKYSERLYLFSLKYLKSVEDAEEIVQAVFLYIWENRKGLKPEASFNSYLFTIAYNLVKKQFLKKAHDNAYKDEILYLSLEEEDCLNKAIDYKCLLTYVELIIEKLPPKRKEVFIKRKFHEMPVKDIAAELGISPNTVENHLTAAQNQMISELQREIQKLNPDAIITKNLMSYLNFLLLFISFLSI